MDNLTLAISIASGLAAIAAVIVSVIALSSTNRVAETQIFLELRKAHNEVHGQMDIRYHDNNWDPTADPNAMKTLEKYWLHTLTEWYSTKILNKGKFRNLWNDYYSRAIAGGLRNKPLRIVLWNMLYGKPGSTFSGYREEFGKTIETIYKQTFHKDLKDDI